MNKLDEVEHSIFQKLWILNQETRPEPIGYLVAAVKKGENKVRVGYSLVKRNSEDKFNKKIGRQIALGRALSDRNKKFHSDINYAMLNFHKRMTKYFKDKQIPELNELIDNKES